VRLQAKYASLTEEEKQTRLQADSRRSMHQ